MSDNTLHVEIKGGTELVERFKALPDLVQLYAVQPAVDKANRIMAAAEAAATPSDSGLLRQSIGISRAKIYKSSLTVWAASGPRTGFKRAVTLTYDKPSSRLVKNRMTKRAAAKPNATIYRMQNPVKYAHIVAHGRKAVAVGGKRAMEMLVGERIIFRKRAAAVAPNDFMRRGYDAAAAAATAVMETEVAAGIEKQWDKLTEKGW